MTTSPWRVWLLEDSALEAGFATAALESRCELTVFSDGGAMLERLAMRASPSCSSSTTSCPGCPASRSAASSARRGTG